MKILLETKCSNFNKMIALIVLYEQGLPNSLSEYHYLQYKFHIASCAYCFYRAEPYTKKKRNFCSYLFKIPKYIYSSKEILAPQLADEYSLIFSKKMSIAHQKSLKKHISKCNACQYWKRITANGWVLSKKEVLEKKQKILGIDVSEINNFLSTRSWKQVSEKYIPPKELKNGIPLEASTSSNIIETIKNVYNFNQEQLDVVLKEKDLLLSIRTIGEKTKKGSIPFLEFNKLMESLNSTLTKITSFITTGQPCTSMNNSIEYLSRCNFLQTSVGSFISNIQLPKNKVIKDDLFEKILSDQVNGAFIDILEFVIKNILNENPDIYLEEYIEQHQNLIQYEILKDISSIILNSCNFSTEFSFQSTQKSKIISTGKLTEEKINNLLNYLDFLKEETEESYIEIQGYIISLHSRNPNLNRNRVVMKATNEKNPISFVLDSERYQRAIESHEKGKEISVSGICKKLKTTIRITKIEKIQFYS